MERGRKHVSKILPGQPGIIFCFCSVGRQLAFISRTGSRQDLSDICQIRAYQRRHSNNCWDQDQGAKPTPATMLSRFFVYRISYTFLLSFAINQWDGGVGGYRISGCTHTGATDMSASASGRLQTRWDRVRRRQLHH